MTSRSRVENLLGRYLSIRPRSEHEVREYLKSKITKYQVSQEEIDGLVTKYKRLNFINDDTFSEMMARAVTQKGKGQRVLQGKLRQAGVEKELITKAMSSLDPEDVKQAMEKRLSRYTQKWVSLTPFTRRAKAYEKLLAAGFSSSEIRSFLDWWLEKE